LHFHDLRREAASRWLDAGVPLHSIQRLLGHANISQTSSYLAVTDSGLHEVMARFDAQRQPKPADDRQWRSDGTGEHTRAADASKDLQSGGRNVAGCLGRFPQLADQRRLRLSGFCIQISDLAESVLGACVQVARGVLRN